MSQTSYLSVNNYVSPFISTAYGMKVNKPGLDYFFRKTTLPFIGQVDLTTYVTDADLRKLERAIIKDNLAHRQYSFFRDNIATSTSEMMVAILLGEGIRISVDGSDEARKIIEEWNDEINVKHESIRDFIHDVWIDNLLNPGSLWRVYVDKDPNADLKVDLQRVSMASITIDEHPTRGWRRFIQTTNIPVRYDNKNRFYRKDPNLYTPTEQVITIIPDEPECCLYVKLFDKAPVSTILPFLVYKRWIMWFMRKFAEKYWAPLLIAYVGDPKSGYMPQKKEVQDESLNSALDTLRRVRDFGAAAFLGHTKVEALETKSKNANLYVEYLEYLNKEIAYGILSSMALRESRGREAATSSIIQQGQLRFVRGMREMISIPLRKFYAKVLLPAHGINSVKPRDIKISWPEIRTEDVDKILNAVSMAARVGAFRDAREIRKILTPIWRHIDENISEKEDKELRNLFLELNSPSRATGDVPQQRAKGVQNKATPGNTITAPK